MKLNKIAFALAGVAFAAAAGAQTVDNWKNGSGDLVWKNGTNELCWRDANWTPATAATGCDGAIVAAAPVAAPAPAAAPAPVAAAPVVVAPVAAAEKVTYTAAAFFDFDKAVLKPAGKAQLDEVVAKSKGVKVEVMIAVGHADATGADDYNQKLSVKRAEAVKAYLVSKGVDAAKIYTEGKGESKPAADNKTKEGRSKNRRVEVEVVGTK